ncbi:MAG: hypothetical protein ACLT40_00495 [Fusobacterium sp.]
MTNKQTMTTNNNTIGGNEMTNRMLDKQEMELIVEAILFNNENRGFTAKGEQFKEAKEQYKRFTKTSDGFAVHNKVNVAGPMADIYEEAMQEELNIMPFDDSKLVGLDAIEAALEADKVNLIEKMEEYDNKSKLKETAKNKLNNRIFDAYKGYFNKFKLYNSTCTSLWKVVYANELGDSETRMRVVFEYKNEKEFAFELPFMTKEGLFIKGGNRYTAMYKISNKTDLIAGKTNKLVLVHPYEWIVDRLLEAYKDEENKSVYYSQDIFDNIVNYWRGLLNKSFNRKVDKIFNNIKEYAWTDNGISPIIFIEKGNSAVGTYSFSKNILFDFTYDELVQIGHIEGVDFLTGSTSEPAKRCKPAAGWDIIRHEDNVMLERISDNKSKVIDYASKFKMSYPAFVKTSAKRDNSATAKDTVNFVDGYEQQYRRKFRTSIENGDLADSTLNKVMKTLWVAKIDLREFLPQELIDLDMYPNVNDCFLLNVYAAEGMLSKFKLPKQDCLTYVMPGNGSKFIGSFRDKGSISRLLRRYIPMVEYQVNSTEEASRLIEALKQMRGEDTWYSVTPYGNVVFELDMIANPSTGRDNVAALVTQSCMEQKCILEGKEIKMSPSEVGAIDVKQLASSRQFDHRVVLYDKHEDKVVYDFGKVAIMLEDFFWQPKHDNKLHSKITEVAFTYHQALDGIKVMIPSLDRAMKNSIDRKSIKEDLLLLEMSVNKISKDVIEENDNEDNSDDEDLLF